MTPKIINLQSAIKSLVEPGMQVAIEGFTHLIPFAAAQEIIRQGITGLTLIRLTPDVIFDQMIGMGCADKLIFSWGGNPGVGSLHRLRDAVENSWPTSLELDERSHAAMCVAYTAGASGLPFGALRGFVGSDLPQYNDSIRFLDCPFTKEKLAVTSAIQPDVAIIHAQQADRQGNVMLWGIVGVQKDIALAAKRVLVTVEEVVDKFAEKSNVTVLPSWTIDTICEVPGGASPSYAHDYYQRDNSAYTEWDEISRSREKFLKWMKHHVLETKSCVEFRVRIQS